MQGELFDGPDPGPERTGRELDTGPVDAADPTMLDVVTPLALSPQRLLPATIDEAMEEIDALRTLQATVEARQFAITAHLAALTPTPAPEQALLPGGEGMVDLGGDGCPPVAEFAVLEIAALLHTTHQATRGQIADALSVRWRHPRMWQAVMGARLPVWQARKIAQAVRWAGLDRAQALRVDKAIAPALGALSWTRLEQLVEGEIVAADPARAAQAEERARTGRYAHVHRDETGTAGVRTVLARIATPDATQLDATLTRLATRLATTDGKDESLDERRARALGILATPERAAALLAGDTTTADRLKAPVRLYVHVNADRLGPDGVARLEGEGAVPVQSLRALLADSTVRVTGVIDHRTSEPVDAYEIPERMREQVILANPYEIFPWGSRRARHTDLDHTTPHSHGGETSPANLGPLGRTAHRAKTHAGWRCHQTRPGHWLWRTPYGRTYHVDNWGTHTPDNPTTDQHSTTELDALLHLTHPQPPAPQPPEPRRHRPNRRKRRRCGARRPGRRARTRTRTRAGRGARRRAG
ncbi:HNH endonuclease signature motif containing protein [Raineyella fluvialis]|uniref:DUF222 domain-containing protein n=1 Tax=Raineyella fluvialis TaxID=2662261 RepID=A0A5Q2FAV5_9ACTN|nr:HNH endonuclease signature motif containing protein [Raineyella fluvialis]QGF23992.1 hypothetical protein Rai3103_10230 [Raineyella fluvialis]